MERESYWDVVVIGGGPAGMMAAGRAAARGRRVLLLEKNPTLGKKLLITGGGRCNVTNNKPVVREMLSKYKENGKFLFSAFSQFGVKETLEFFQQQGMAIKEEAEGRLFPATEKARTVLDVLIHVMRKHGVKVRTASTVAGITYDATASQVVVTLSDGFIIRAASCVVASGGTSHPETGSTGEGFMWMKLLGHTIVKDDASLVPIALSDAWVREAAGVTLPAIKLTTYLHGKKQNVYKGKLLFTHFGVSGPTILNMSQDVGELLRQSNDPEYIRKTQDVVDAPKAHQGVTMNLDIFPTLDNAALRKKVQSLLIEQSNKKIKNVLAEIMAPALVTPILALAKIDGETPCHSVRHEERTELVALLKAIPLHVVSLLGKEKAIVSSGGVSLDEVDFKTMQSRLIPALYLVGDILNIDRPSGGYSLQLCWTTGYVAGDHC